MDLDGIFFIETLGVLAAIEGDFVEVDNFMEYSSLESLTITLDYS